MDFRVKNGLAVTNTATIESTLTSVSIETGALRVAGGAGIAKDVYVGGIFSATGAITGLSNLDISGSGAFDSTTESTTTATGALTVAGGAGIGKKLNVGGDLKVFSTTPAVSTSSGALQIEGGAAVKGDFWVGGVIYGSVDASVNTATNLAQGSAGQIPYQTGFGQTAFFGPGSAGDLIISQGTAGPTFVNTTTVTVGAAATSTNLLAGSTGSIPYQTTSGVTTFLGIGTENQILVVNAGATAPQWRNTSSVIVGNAINSVFADNSKIATENADVTANYLLFASTGSNNYTNLKVNPAQLYFIPSNGRLGIGKSPTAKLDVDGTVIISGISTVTNTTQATNSSTGALQVKGGASFSGNVFIWNTLTVQSEAASTTTVTGNAAYVVGGLAVGKSLYVKGKALFEDNVTFQGTTTNVFSTNTVYTDNIIDIHFPSGGTNDGVWAVDDGQDLGFVFHYYQDPGVGNADAALVFYNDTHELRWIESGIKWINTGTWDFNTNTVVYGTIRTGGLHLEHTTASTSISTGALTVAGGAGIAGNLYVGGTIFGVAEVTGQISTASNISGGTAGQLVYQTGPGNTAFFGPGNTGSVLVSNWTSAPSFQTTTTLFVGRAVTATNITSGTTAQVPYQVSPGITGFFGPGTAGQLLVSQGANAAGPVFTNTSSIFVGFAGNSHNSLLTNDTASTDRQYITFVSTTTGYTPIKGSAMSGLVFVPSPGRLGVLTGTPQATLDINGGTFLRGITTVTNTTNASSTNTGALQVVGGAGIHLNLQVGGNGVFGGDLAVNGGDITSSGATFNLVNTTVATLNLGGAASTINIGAGNGTTTVNNQLRANSSTNATSTTTGALIVTGGAGIQKDLWVGGTIYGVFNGTVSGVATTATNLANGTAGQVPYQTAPGQTSFYGPGTAGQLLVSAGAAAPVYTNTASIWVGNATTATHLRNGSAGALPYQTAVGQTNFINLGPLNYVLTAGATEPIWSIASSIGAGSAETIEINNVPNSTDLQFITFVNTSSGFTDLNVSAGTGLTYRPSAASFGINTDNPGYTLDVNSSTNAIIRAYGATKGGVNVQNNSKHYSINAVGTDFTIYDETSANTRIKVTTAGDVGINVLTPASRLDVGGTARISGITTVTNVTQATNTTTGALHVYGGVGVGGNVYVKNRVGFVNASNVSRVYQVYNATTDSLDTVFE